MCSALWQHTIWRSQHDWHSTWKTILQSILIPKMASTHLSFHTLCLDKMWFRSIKTIFHNWTRSKSVNIPQNLPMGISRLKILWSPLMYSTSTMIGAEYVMSRSLHSCGAVSLTMFMPSSIFGFPTRTSIYLKTNQLYHYNTVNLNDHILVEICLDLF